LQLKQGELKNKFRPKHTVMAFVAWLLPQWLRFDAKPVIRDCGTAVKGLGVLLFPLPILILLDAAFISVVA
jgi:hypothetical protein